MSSLQYPKGLPAPTGLPVTSAERRAPSEGPIDLRPASLGWFGTRDLTFPPMTSEQAGEFADWWRDSLVLGAGWFVAPWPLPSGVPVAEYRFTEPPRFQWIPLKIDGGWRISAPCEVRPGRLAEAEDLPAPGGYRPIDIYFICDTREPVTLFFVRHEGTQLLDVPVLTGVAYEGVSELIVLLVPPGQTVPSPVLYTTLSGVIANEYGGFTAEGTAAKLGNAGFVIPLQGAFISGVAGRCHLTITVDGEHYATATISVSPVASSVIAVTATTTYAADAP